jgi:folate-dependent phosphoribosylglycinamide formyltransferase PurN
MNLAGIFGDHPRHRYIARQLAEAGRLQGIVVEEREEHIPEPPSRLDGHLSELYRHHFQRRGEAEQQFLGADPFPDVPSRHISRDELNSEPVSEFLQDLDPNLTLTYGVHILNDETLSAIPGDVWNVHGGLSPEYRGVTTHFWPSYRLEPQKTCVTLHEISSDIDGGAIVHQTPPPLVRGDGIHQLACRTVEQFGEELPRVVSLAVADELSPPVEQEQTGKLWTSDDWRPEHLLVIYDAFDNDIVDMYLDGELTQREPELIRQFE